MQKLNFPSTKAAAHFVEEAQAQGYRARLPAGARILPRMTVWAIIIGALIGGALFGVIGGLAEAGQLGLPRLEPLFAAPVGAVTALLATFGGSLGALIGGFIGLHPVAPLTTYADTEVLVDGVLVDDNADKAALEKLAMPYRGYWSDRAVTRQGERAPAATQHSDKITLNRVLAWVITVVTAAILIQATVYIWYLALDYGHGADQQSRIGYTMKNVQRIPADTPEQAGAALATILGGETMGVAADPVAAAVAAPVAAAQGQTLVYGGGDSALNPDQLRRIAAQANVAVVIATEEPAYALPAAYAAAYFRVPVVPLAQVVDVLEQSQTRLLLVAAPARLISNDQLAALAAYGQVERVASDNIYQHALLWARSRWGDFGWGIDERTQVDGYFDFTLANPDDPAFAAAGLPMAYSGNFGPLLYTPRDDLDELTDQYLWRLGPDYFAIPSDGPFVNVRVVGGPQSVSYGAQARADLALETHSYRNEATGVSGTAAAGWMWFFVGLAGFIWALFAMPRRLPDSGFYPRLYWPLAMLVLGPLGILAFFWAYQGRPVARAEQRNSYVRPLWSQTVAATIMGMGIGMALMIAAMYLWEFFGLPVGTGVSYTWWQWLGAPMGAFMWVLMVIPAIIISIFFFMGPMLAEMHGKGYGHGVRMAAPVVIYSMVAASIGMFAFAYWTMNWEELMTKEDLWLWVTPLWFAAVCGFFTALIPNYWMVRTGRKMGGM